MVGLVGCGVDEAEAGWALAAGLTSPLLAVPLMALGPKAARSISSGAERVRSSSISSLNHRQLPFQMRFGSRPSAFKIIDRVVGPQSNNECQTKHTHSVKQMHGCR